MGMFDYLYVDNKHIPHIRELVERGYKVESFQTKSLDNCLIDYYIDEAGFLWFDDVEFDVYYREMSKPVAEAYRLPVFSEKSRKKVRSEYTGSIIATAHCTNFEEKNDDVWLQLEFLFVDGVLYKPSKISSLKITTYEEILETKQKWKKIYEKRKKDPIYKLVYFLRKCINFTINKLNKIDYWLIMYDVK
jgi:hypothetical protein